MRSRAGAAAVVSAEYIDIKGAALVEAADPFAAMARISANFYNHPDKILFLIGITGTNGKTTITYFLESIFDSARKPAGVFGTINYRYRDKIVPAPNTTPQSADIYKLLHAMEGDGIKTAVMEVSSHALSLGRVEGLEFDCAVFTNLTQDHLDFHKTMEQYFEAKSRLFTGLNEGEKKFNKKAVINVDDPWGRKLVNKIANAGIITYGIENDADLKAENIKITSHSSEFNLTGSFGKAKVELALIGQHNVYNALASLGAALCAGITLEEAIKGVEDLKSVPGRLEKVETQLPFSVVVDYAHTEDALHNVLSALRKLKPKRIITVFGAGGERDTKKRPLMGEVAVSLSDYVFVTSDNPRGESPERIALDIEEGIRKHRKSNYSVILDREQAIAAAVKITRPGDILLIAGKGHETYQIIGEQKIHFNDAEMARKYLAKLENGQDGKNKS